VDSSLRFLVSSAAGAGACGGGMGGVGVGTVYPGVSPDSAKSLRSPGVGFGNSYTKRGQLRS
jgi:hypothetical protein